jgi:gag-polyprotein putative aspartyl protease
MRTVPLIRRPDPDGTGNALFLLDATIAGRPYRFLLDTGASRSQVEADEYTSALSQIAEHGSSGAFASRTEPVVTITDLAIGDLRVPSLDVTRVQPLPDHPRTLIGMDVLGRHRCHFRFDAQVLELDPPSLSGTGHELTMDSRGHCYVDVGWPARGGRAAVTGRACWDSGSEVTIVNQAFWHAHPGLFEAAGTIAGTDATGAQLETPLLTTAGYEIGGRAFAGHEVVAVDLTRANSAIDIPMDLIVGYPTLRQASWLFDFPARRWMLTGG